MSHKPTSELGFKTLSDRFQKSVTCDGDDTNKPDFRELDLGLGPGSASPISPLRVGPTISSSSSSSGSVSGRIGVGSGGTINHQHHSGELTVDSSPTFSVGGSRVVKSGHAHTRPDSGTSSATSPAMNVLPAGNICPSGRVLKTGMMSNRSSKPEVLSLGSGNYGHGSIMRGGSGTGTGTGKTDTHVPVSSNSRRMSMDPEELKRLGNEEYKKGHFLEALRLYDKAIGLSPANAAYHCNRAAALMGLKRLSEAVKECDEAIKLDSGYVRAHHRLGSLLVSLGQVENARRHLYFKGYQPDPNEAQKLQVVEKHLNKCTDLRRVRDWGNVLKESDAAIVSGADACAQLFACKAEALLKLHQLDDADSVISHLPKFEASNSSLSCSQMKLFGMQSEAYVLFVRAQIDLSLGRFENALTSIEKSGHIDPRNVEVAVLLQNIRSLCKSRARGNELFKSERYTEACSAYGDGLKSDPSNPILYCNRAACWFKLGQFERSLDDCNQALLIHPHYTKALLRRAATFSKLERWAESVRDYEVLRRALPNDNDIAESLFHAQVALKKSRGEEVYNLKFGGEVELINDLEQFKAAVVTTGASVVLFKTASELQCKQISPFLDTLCKRYPSINFLKVDIEESPTIANVENVRIVPTIKIYKKGNRMKELVCPCREVLESSVRHYSF
ncbi:putative tetratricopeptide-like helical domain superfamily, Thioredoxin domain-containing protein [Helianthus annuus]|nr:putative tetratricopeptide-like helical domain superfamily, Thioredoxin domain-containing protein [Helianthus annuus]KAJ0508112.1 putative tetratricopeptide-like helical domain superfamily, Thioredoxin domain-containing protein [Helianthus annuus]KAJ0688369.1 putative tetratricopeptide-like helical domain superfamily, Thioredoxin domain-containing protein [Helianthus annuus]KAJ0869514.1 putative tetratricopeptide-like helical domain superfamily, Thioredoxin domain-containing protein [Helianth